VDLRQTPVPGPEPAPTGRPELASPDTVGGSVVE
jgi:hypothetical protein